MTIAERDKNGRVIGTRDAHVWHCSLSLHPQEPELADERWAEICEQFIEQMGFAGETREGAVPVGGDPSRALCGRLRPRPHRGDPGGGGRQQGQRPQRPAARAESVPGARAAVRAPPPGGAHPRGRQPRPEARRARRRSPPRPAARRPRRARRALEPADARADRPRLRDRQPRRERVHPPTSRRRRAAAPPLRRGRHRRGGRLLRPAPGRRATGRGGACGTAAAGWRAT